MPVQAIHRSTFLFIIFLLPVTQLFSQRYLSDYDSTLFIRDTVRPLAKRFANLNIGGYMQPQFQVAQSEGASSYDGGNFSEFASNRFMLRRARLKFDYILPSKDRDFPKALFTFQFDATERGAFVRDMFLRVYEPKHQNFSILTGLVARPFGFEVNLSSSYRETPERGRMSQILMPSERDLGAMIMYESQKPNHKSPLKFDIGVFNGQGLSGTTDFDSYKDVISRLTVKPLNLSKAVFISGGLSFLNGGWRQATRYRYEMSEQNGNKVFAVDSSVANIGGKASRRYYGADVQLGYKHAWGKTEVRAEYWKGKQPGTASSTANPGTLPLAPTYVRNFDGAFFYFLQNIVNEKWELMAKYDWYDPNKKAEKKEIGATNLTAADIRFSALGFGITRYFTDNLKVLVYYNIVRNENTLLPGFTSDSKDNIFTCRMQVRF
jgi:hypothetical protein